MMDSRGAAESERLSRVHACGTVHRGQGRLVKGHKTRVADLVRGKDSKFWEKIVFTFFF